MKKIIILCFICLIIVGCSGIKKPPLSPTQVVDGQSIIIPPEFDVMPEESKEK